MKANDPLFGIHADALTLQKQRMDLLASNLANTDTPGYLARDIDFSRVLSNQIGDGDPATQLDATNSRHLSTANTPLSETRPDWRVPLQPSRDGNTVDAQIEQAAFADAAMHYQASLSFLDGRLKSLMTAITGQ